MIYLWVAPPGRLKGDSTPLEERRPPVPGRLLSPLLPRRRPAVALSTPASHLPSPFFFLFPHPILHLTLGHLTAAARRRPVTPRRIYLLVARICAPPAVDGGSRDQCWSAGRLVASSPSTARRIRLPWQGPPLGSAGPWTGALIGHGGGPVPPVAYWFPPAGPSSRSGAYGTLALVAAVAAESILGLP
jgi:hypothetical protein